MSTIETSRDHRCSRTTSAGASPSHRDIGRRTLSYASIGPLGSAARRAGIALGIVIGSALLVASSAIHLELWPMGYRTIPTIGRFFLSRQSPAPFSRTPVVVASSTHGRRGRIYDRHHRRIATERLLSGCSVSWIPCRHRTQVCRWESRAPEPLSLPLAAQSFYVGMVTQTNGLRTWSRRRRTESSSPA